MLFLEEIVRYLYGLMVWLYIYVISGWTKYKTKCSEAGIVCFKIWIFSSSFEKLKDSATVKFSDINAQWKNYNTNC